MHRDSEEKRLAHAIVLDLENEKKSMHMICMQASRLALLLNNPDKSTYFTEKARKVSELEAFLNTYGLVMPELIKKIDLDDLYEFDDLTGHHELLEQLSTALNAFDSISERKKRNPIDDVKKYWLYKEKYADIQSEVYEYAVGTLYQLKFSEKVLDIFNEYEDRVNNMLPELLPNSKEKLDSISKNLQSQNKEDWSNAVHLCRKLLQDFSDALHPPSYEPITDKNGKEHDVGPKAYKNRLKNFVHEHAGSENYRQITNANMSYIAARIDAIYDASNKGSHETISTIEEAKRYVIYTYMLIGDILMLRDEGEGAR